ncbi:MAG: restriction endonuclease [Deltaproteobacteria bacterium]|nr:restriction endonuclease [Deltaproteobacteria bacterium]
MTFTDAAAEVLRLLGKPLHYKEITAFAIEKNLLSHVGKSPEVTMGARLAALFKKEGEETALVRVKPGVFALKEWEQSGQLKQMLAKSKAEKGKAPPAEVKEARVEEPPAKADDAAPALEQAQEQAPRSSRSGRGDRRGERPGRAERAAERQAEAQAAAASAAPAQAPEEPAAPPAPVAPVLAAPAPIAAPAPAAAPVVPHQPEDFEDDEPVVRSAEEIARTELAAGAAGLFEEEDDDDQPILGGGPEQSGEREGRRRRRRRRRKGGQDGNGSLPTYSVSPAFADASHDAAIHAEPRTPSAASGPVVLEVSASALDNIALDDFGGRDMADAIAIVLGAFDRAQGPVSLRQIAEAAQKRARLSGDLQQVQSQIAAAVRADNMRRVANGQRPRFRFAGGRIALTDWLLTGDLARLEQEAIAAVERYRDAARKAFVRKIQELPGHAFVELTLLALERMGFVNVRAVRRAGVPGNESHFSALHKTGAIEIPSALVIRRDGREIGRERVSELRGSLHHYGPASAGWLITSGQVLSGAREEAGATQTSSIALLDGPGLARLCEKHDIAVIHARLPVAIPDVDLLEALRAS